MFGTIRKWEVLTHPVVTIQCFGWTVFVRAVFAGREQTFLSLLSETGVFGRPLVPFTVLIGRCIELERRAMRIYQSLALRFDQRPLAREFFEELARQEQTHAELLEICRAAADRGRRDEQCFDPWQDTVPQTENRLEEAEAGLDADASLADALRLVIAAESSQINELFSDVVQATDPRLASKFMAFGNAVKSHLRYLGERIPVLEPSLAESAELLRSVSSKQPFVN